jgi:hypothetical protein
VFGITPHLHLSLDFGHVRKIVLFIFFIKLHVSCNFSSIAEWREYRIAKSDFLLEYLCLKQNLLGSIWLHACFLDPKSRKLCFLIFGMRFLVFYTVEVS